MSALEIVLAVLVGGALVVLAWALLETRRQLDAARRPGPDPVAGLLQQQIEAVRAESRTGQEGLRREVGDLGNRLREDASELRLAVATELKGVSAEVARQLADGMELGLPIVTCGPGNRLIPHQVDEYVETEELFDAAKIYAASALKFLEG